MPLAYEIAPSLALAPSLQPGVATPGAARVLIVDEEAMMRRALANFLRERGYDVHECKTGEAALARLEHERFAVLLCDLHMPEMSGLDVVSRARALDHNLAVLMLTTVNEANAAREALTRGALDYLVKPVALTDVHLAVERAMHCRQLEIDRRNVERHLRLRFMGSPSASPRR